MDRAIAASLPAVAVRFRAVDMVDLAADALLPATLAQPHRPLALISLAGGPASECWNTLIRLHATAPSLLAAAPATSIRVLEPDPAGPIFGQAALHRLTQPDGPLANLAIAYTHHAWDWSQPDSLATALGLVAPAAELPQPIVVLFAEGSLFEYATDEQISTTLAQLRALTPQDAVLVGSVTRSGPVMAATTYQGAPNTRPHTLDDFERLSAAAGWHTQAVRTRPLSFNLRLGRR